MEIDLIRILVPMGQGPVQALEPPPADTAFDFFQWLLFSHQNAQRFQVQRKIFFQLRRCEGGGEGCLTHAHGGFDPGSQNT